MSDVAVCIPVLGRPTRVAAVLGALRASQGHLRLRPLFVCSPEDHDEIAAVRASGSDFIVVPWQPGSGDFARKTNQAFTETDEPWFFAGADDLLFHPGWADEAVRCGDELQVGMVGTNDLGNQLVIAGAHATHSLFRRGYIEECGTIDQPGQVYHPEYDHQFCDNEAYETAMFRGCFTHAAASIVEHQHPFWGKAEMDDTYRKGLAAAATDRQLFLSRRPLWQ